MDNFYDSETEESISVESSSFGLLNKNSDPIIYLKVCSILFVRAGLFLSHVSSIPSSNIQVLIFQNIIDVAVNTVIYALIGYLFAFGKDVGAFIGIEGFLEDKTDKNEFVDGWLIVIAVSGLLVAAIGDRISFFASSLLNVLISGLICPIIIHWILSDKGWMRVNSITKVKVSYKDYSYSCLIHMSGGFVAFLSLLILNKRLLRFKDMDACSIPDNGPSLALFGNLCTIIGFFGIGIPSKKYVITHLDYDFYGTVLVNTLLSVFGSILSSLLLTFSCPFEPMHKWTSMRSIQAGVSGIAVIAGGADVYYPMAALLIGLCNGFIFFLVSYLINISPIEDYSNIIACYCVSGLLGTLLPPIFGVREGFDTSFYYCVIHFLWQLACDLVILGFILIAFFPIMLVLDYCSILRSWDEDINHRRALFASKRKKNQIDIFQMYDNQGVVETVNYNQTEINYEENNLQEIPQAPQGGVNILYEKQALNPIEEGEGVFAGSYLADTSSSEKNVENFIQEIPMKASNEEYIVNYMINSKPFSFFEEISDSTQSSSIVVKGCGDSHKNSRFFDAKVIKGIRNISDSKLFQKLKGNWIVPKKRMLWSRERKPIKCSSVSNIWLPTFPGISIETQV